MSAKLLIGQLAREAAIKTDAVRFYEKTGLLRRPARSANGYRTYDEAATAQLRFIKKAQSLCFSLAEIKRILRLRGRSDCCRSVLKDRGEAPAFGDEGAPDAWLEMNDDVADGLEGIAVGDEIIVVTWLISLVATS